MHDTEPDMGPAEAAWMIRLSHLADKLYEDGISGEGLDLVLEVIMEARAMGGVDG